MGGCATPPANLAPPASQETTSPQPSSVACAQVEGVDLPPECIPYDPEALMAANERYKERLPVSAEAFAGFEAKRPEITAAIEALQLAGELSPDAVAAILDDNGVTGSKVGMTDGVVTFGGGGPLGGCVFGTASATEIDMSIKGVVMDGGCTALSGH